MSRFLNKVAIITGSSNGIGRATAVLLASEGSKITITGRNAESLRETERDCLSAGSSKKNIYSVLGDITNSAVRSQLVGETLDKFGKLDILINNHGVFLNENYADANLEAFDETLNVNTKSSMAMCLKALPYLVKTKGCVVNVSSVAAKVSNDPNFCYSMSKAALDQMTRLLATAYASYGVRINSVNPGFVRTAIMDKLGLPKEVQQEFLNVVQRTIVPFGRIGRAEEIAKLIAFLCDTDSAGYITGQTIVADGGLSLDGAGFEHPEIKALIKKLRG